MRRSTYNLILFVALALTVSGCGGGSAALPSGKPVAADALAITTTRLPDGQRAGEYPPTQLIAQGARGPVQWHLLDGRLPVGVSLSAGGMLSGRPGEEGLFPFAVAVTDGVDTDARDLVLGVDAFGASVAGLFFGEAWSGSPLTIDAVCATGPVLFEMLATQSQGGFDRIDSEAGQAVWIPGNTTTAAVDHVRLTDTTSGATTEITLHVMPHPAANMQAEFGSTDVWYVDVSHRFGAHAFPRDWDAMLSMLGLRSDETVPTTADRLASWLVRREVLAGLNQHFDRNADGSRGQGLPISFPLERPAAPFETVPPGGWATGADNRYSVISILHGSEDGVLGMAFTDDESNSLTENDTTSGSMGEMGVFGNVLANAFNAAYQNTSLPHEPITPADEPLLRDLVHGRPVQGHRATHIQSVVRYFAVPAAMILAHEIGHSLGLTHNRYAADGSIMNAYASIYREAEYGFLPEHREQLNRALPGPGRLGEGGTQAASLPAGGVQACTLRLRTPTECTCTHHGSTPASPE